MTTNHDLARQIEDLVRQHVDALRISAAAAVARAFAAVPPAISPVRASTPTKPVRTRKQGAPRRVPAELVALGERFYAVLCQRPGETMTTLAPPELRHAERARQPVCRAPHDRGPHCPQ